MCKVQWMGHFLTHHEIKIKISKKFFLEKKNDFWMGHFFDPSQKSK